MTNIGWILMIVSWTAIITLFTFCLVKVMTSRSDG